VQGLCNGRLSVRLSPSVCPVDRQQQRRAAGLLRSSDACSRYRSTAAGARAAAAGSVMLLSRGTTLNAEDWILTLTRAQRTCTRRLIRLIAGLCRLLLPRTLIRIRRIALIDALWSVVRSTQPPYPHCTLPGSLNGRRLSTARLRRTRPVPVAGRK